MHSPPAVTLGKCEYKVDIWPWFEPDDERLSTDWHFRLSLRTTAKGVSHVVQHVSWLVVRRCGSRRRWSVAKVKVRQVCADGTGAVKDECWAWTEERGGQMTSCDD
jgi:hypothetical protein